MADNLLCEIYEYLHISGSTPPKYIRYYQYIINNLLCVYVVSCLFSFIGHSMGNLVIRRLLDKEEMGPLLDKLSVYVSLCGPHLGSLVYTSGFVQAG